MRLHTQFYHGISNRSDMTDLGRRLHFDTHRALDMTKIAIVLQEAVDAGRMHPRKAELYHAQASTLLAQLSSDMGHQDPGWQAGVGERSCRTCANNGDDCTADGGAGPCIQGRANVLRSWAPIATAEGS